MKNPICKYCRRELLGDRKIPFGPWCDFRCYDEWVSVQDEGDERAEYLGIDERWVMPTCPERFNTKNMMNGKPLTHSCNLSWMEWDDVATHLIDHHGWDYETTRLWLRDKIKREAFNENA